MAYSENDNERKSEACFASVDAEVAEDAKANASVSAILLRNVFS